MIASDLALHTALGAHDPRAFEAVYDRHAKLAYGIALGICHSAQDAEDAVQQAFLDVWRAADRFDPAHGTLTSWICSLVRNRSIDALRRRRSREDRAERAAVAARYEPLEDVATEAARRADVRALRDALDALPATQREVVLLAYGGGLTQDQIAERLTLPLGTIKSRTRLGLARMRLTLEGAEAA